MRSRKLDDDDDRVLSKFRTHKAQSGAMAEAVLETVAHKRDLADNDPALSDQERARLYSDAATFERRAKRQLACARRSRLEVHQVMPNVSARVFIREGFGCGRPLCMICGRQKSRKLHEKLLEAYDRAHERMPGIRALELVLTQPASPLPDLAKGIDRLHHGIRKLLRTPHFELALAGSFRRTEITFNAETQTFHIHAHLCLIARPSYFDGGRYLTHELITQLWAGIIGVDGFVDVSIRAVGKRTESGELIPNTERAGLWHTTKYIAKPISVFDRPDPETNRFVVSPELAEAFEVGLFRRRMHAFAGILKSRWKP